ncbi:MAG: extracellular elastinolytic metalloproteinase, partial [Patiriisocius sp.]
MNFFRNFIKQHLIAFVLLVIPFFATAQQKGNSSLSEKHVVTSSHVSSISGTTHTYARQTFNGFEIIGTESSEHIDVSGNLLMSHHNFIPNVSAFVRSSSHTMSVEQAISNVAQQMSYGTVTGLSQLTENIETNTYTFSVPSISNRAVTVKPYYFYSKITGVISVYEVFIYEKGAGHAYNFYVDASSGAIVDKRDLMSSCSFDTKGEHDHSNTIDTKINTIVEESSFIGPLAETALIGSYHVFPLPVESPYYGGRASISNPDNAIASPFGWHDTNGVAGAEFTTTQGNNVRAFDDGNGTNAPLGNGSSFAEGGASLNFNFPLNISYSSGDQSQDA